MNNLASKICVAAILILTGMQYCFAEEAAAAKPERVEITFREVGKVLNQLNTLGQQFDTDHNSILSPQEQEAMVKFVSEKRGALWGNRLSTFLKAADTNHDGSVDLKEWNQGIEKAKASAEAVGQALPTKTEMLAMADGKHLATDIYLPETAGPFPVIFMRTPYGRMKHSVASFGSELKKGFAIVNQDMRGRFDSEGENIPFIGCGWGEHKDGAETLAWILKQPWCNGKICTQGGSAGGITQNYLAGAAPEGITAQHITVAATSMYGDAAYSGGAQLKSQIEKWTLGNKYDDKALELQRAHPNYDDYWRGYDSSLKFGDMHCPAVHVGGWFDTFTHGTISTFVGRQYHGGEGAKGKQKLVMGPWIHGVGKAEVGELVFPNAKVPDTFSTARWFDYFLKGTPNGVMDEPAVLYYVMGDVKDPKAPGNIWRKAADWPIPCSATSYYFSKSGTLNAAKPTETDAAIEYTFDPANPCPTIGGNNLTIPAGPRNQNSLESRKDVVLFSTEPLTEPVEVTGAVTLKAFVASSAVDTDVDVHVCDVYPDGKSYNICEGILRLRFRHSFEKPEPLVRGQVEEVSVECWPTSIVFNRGHRIRVMVSSSNFPRFDVNPGTGKPIQDGEPGVKQTNRILCDAGHPSCIVLPIVKQGAN